VERIQVVEMIWISIAIAMAGVSLAMTAGPKSPVETVPAVDLKRYSGKWYEIARFPNRFQRSCAGDVSATYTLRPDGKMTVLNECRTAEGKVKKATGTARLADPRGATSKLKVTFFWPFSGDYWVIGLDAGYRWALVGDPERDYLWVLSREPKMDDTVYRDVVARAAAQGFDVSKLVRTKQAEASRSEPGSPVRE
jgi:apolipoprotein D and lipocalin family protein